MIIQKAGVLKYLRYLGIFCALTMGFVSIVATSEEDAADALGVDTDFDQDFDLAVNEITVEKTAEPGPAAAYSNCEENLSIQQGIDALENSDIDDVDLDSVTLNYLEVRYKDATWQTLAADSLTCSVSLTEVDPPATRDAYNTTFPSIQIIQNSSDWTSLTLSDDNKTVINHYLNNRTEEFHICVECDDNAGEITEFSVTVEANLDIKIKGSLL